jgi:Uma2 family endonuclease
MPTEQRLLTAEDLWNMPDDDTRRELWDGVLEEMSPAGGRHGETMTVAGSLLYAHGHGRKVGRVLVGDVGFVLRRGPDRVIAPDICFISAELLPAEGTPEAFVDIVPDFVI